jgi:NAD(P)-dependent dehydrogenase (short-subunit alcohol dehydrogenase family)
MLPFKTNQTMTSQGTRVVFVTGGAYGIGRATVRYFATRGDAVVISDQNAERGNALEAELSKEGLAVMFLHTDIRSEQNVRSAIETTTKHWGGIDVVCNNAGVELNRRADQFSSKEYDVMVDTNLRGAFLCSKYAFPSLQQRKGSIINIASVQGIACEANTAVYAATKAALLGLTRGMARDFAPDVRVNAICPGATLTGMMDESLAAHPNPQIALETMAQNIPLRRLALPEDIAPAIYFLASKEASYFTGSALVVDGGLLAKLAI